MIRTSGTGSESLSGSTKHGIRLRSGELLVVLLHTPCA